MLEALLMGENKKKPFVFFTASDYVVIKTDTVNGETQYGEVWKWTSPDRIRGLVADSEGGIFVATKGTLSSSSFTIRKIVDGAEQYRFTLFGSRENNVFHFCGGEDDQTLYVVYRRDGISSTQIVKYKVDGSGNINTAWASNDFSPVVISYDLGKLFAASLSQIAEISPFSGNERTRVSVNGSCRSVLANGVIGVGYVTTSLFTQSFSGYPLTLQYQYDTNTNTAQITSDVNGNAIVCHNSDLIQKFDSNLNLLWEYTQGNVFQRIAATCDEDGNIYSISNGGANAGTIKVLDSSGNTIDDVKTPVNFDTGFRFIASYQEWRRP